MVETTVHKVLSTKTCKLYTSYKNRHFIQQVYILTGVAEYLILFEYVV